VVDLGSVSWSWLLPACCLGCGVVLRRECVPELCTACAAECAPLPTAARELDGVVAVWPYAGAFAQALVRFKYQGDAALAGPLGRVLAGEPMLAASSWDLVCAVPMHWRRRWRRGFDHAALLLAHAVRASAAPPRHAPLLRRVRHDPPQAELPAAERRENLVGAFAVLRSMRAQVVGANVLVVDDVTTTGATLQAAAHALESAGAARVGRLALLRTPTP
jgi:ComF family protein